MVLPPFPSSSALRDGNSQENKKKTEQKAQKAVSSTEGPRKDESRIQDAG